MMRLPPTRTAQASLPPALMLLLLAGGCLGVSYRGVAGVSRSSDTTRVIVDAPVGIDSRSPDTYSTLSSRDRTVLGFFGLTPRITYKTGTGRVGGGVAMTAGVSSFAGRYGAVGLISLGVLAGEGESERVMSRLQIGFEIEAGASDWRVSRGPRCAFSSRDHSFRPEVRNHRLIGLLPGIEYISGNGGEWAFSVSASFRQVLEPTCN